MEPPKAVAALRELRKIDENKYKEELSCQLRELRDFRFKVKTSKVMTAISEKEKLINNYLENQVDTKYPFQDFNDGETLPKLSFLGHKYFYCLRTLLNESFESAELEGFFLFSFLFICLLGVTGSNKNSVGLYNG